MPLLSLECWRLFGSLQKKRKKLGKSHDFPRYNRPWSSGFPVSSSAKRQKLWAASRASGQGKNERPSPGRKWWLWTSWCCFSGDFLFLALLKGPFRLHFFKVFWGFLSKTKICKYSYYYVPRSVSTLFKSTKIRSFTVKTRVKQVLSIYKFVFDVLVSNSIL